MLLRRLISLLALLRRLSTTHILFQIIAAQVDLLIAPFPVFATHRPVMRVALHAAPPQHFEPRTGAWSWLRVGRESCRAAAATGLGDGFAACEVMTLLHVGTQNGSSLLHELQAIGNCANAVHQHNAFIGNRFDIVAVPRL